MRTREQVELELRIAEGEFTYAKKQLTEHLLLRAEYAETVPPVPKSAHDALVIGKNKIESLRRELALLTNKQELSRIESNVLEEKAKAVQNLDLVANLSI